MARRRGWKWDANNSRLSVYVDGTEVARFDDATSDLALLVNGIDIPAGKLSIDSDTIDATPAEINTVCDPTLDTTDGLQRMHVSRSTYDFAVDGGTIAAHGLGETLPDNAIICGGFVDVVTTCTTEGTDAGTMAISVLTANDIVAAIAVVDGGNPWDAGLQAIIPKANTPESTGIKLTAAKEVTATIATQAFTAGKFHVFLYYMVGD